MQIREALYDWVIRTAHLNYGRERILAWVREEVASAPAGSAIRVLDIGAGKGADLLNIRAGCPGVGLELHGVESHPGNAAAAREAGISVYELDIERGPVPLPDASFDIVIANQVVEHAKEIFWIFSEISRVLRPGGLCIVGVPNLAALHNRVLLLFGFQPSCVGVLSAHVRGFTRSGFREFATCEGYFRLEEVRGANLYPFPPTMARTLARLFPGFSVCLFFRLRRTRKEGTFLRVLDTRFFETPYYRGPSGGDPP
jgi:SAM-dependent methyltransferase